MNFTEKIYLGICPTHSKRPLFVCRGVDARFKTILSIQAEWEDILLEIGENFQGVIAINAPQRLNLGIINKPETRQRLGITGSARRPLNLRLGEFLLQQQGLHVTKTPAIEEKCPEWMRRSFQLYRKLDALGFGQNGAPEHLYIEVSAESAFLAFKDTHLFDHTTLEGRLQRQLLLYEKGLPVPDPMEFFEEITRFRLLHGTLPLDIVLNQTEINAMMAAYLAWLTAHQPQEITFLGTAEEGHITIPRTEKAQQPPMQPNLSL